MKLEYAIEAAALGLFMLSASTVAVLVEHPAYPVRDAIADPALRRLLIGIGMGLTAMALIYSPMGMRSGAHMNPSVTLTFWRLGRVDGGLAVRYAAAQFAGAVVGLWVASRALGAPLADLHFIATRPGGAGLLAAFAAEASISFVLMLVVLLASSSTRLARWTGTLVGLLIAAYITVEEPLSGMSMNPARTLAPWVVGGVGTPLWIYFSAPTLGMLLASEAFVRMRGEAGIPCAKLRHPSSGPCVFGCDRRQARAAERATAAAPAHQTT